MFSRIKNYILLRCFPRIFPQAVPQPHNILVVSTTGLGDTIFGIPAISCLKKNYPSAFLAVLTSPIGKEVLSNNPAIDEIFSLPKSLFFSFFCLKRQLKKKPWDLIFVFHASQRLIFPLCASLKPKRLIGTLQKNKGLDALFSDLFPWKGAHEVERRFDLIASFVKTISPSFPQIFLQETEKAWGLSFFSSSQPILAIHPGAQDRYKCWPVSAWIELCKLLQQENRFQIVLVAGEKEQDLQKTLQEKLPFVKSIPILDLRKLAAFLSRVSIFIANDTGPMHLASSLQIPTIALFSPTDPRVCGPYQSSHTKVLYKSKSCIPCLQRKCQLPFCLYQISPKEVFLEVQNICENICKNP